MTMPLPFMKISVLAVPKSIPISFENINAAPFVLPSVRRFVFFIGPVIFCRSGGPAFSCPGLPVSAVRQGGRIKTMYAGPSDGPHMGDLSPNWQ